MALLARIFAPGQPHLAAVIVVDSLSDGKLEQEINRTGWPVKYENASRNLGSAGNLARRLELAAQEDADWCFAINHDGVFDRGMIAALADEGRSDPRAGAVFPRRILINRGGTSLRPPQSVFDMPRFSSGKRSSAVPDGQVAWDSSNGALYALQPIREALHPWADFWMGWEDLAYGWLLSTNGWKQLYCSSVEYPDDYEYQPVRLLGRTFYIARKPTWYAYYLRNLALFARRSGGGVEAWRLVVNRVIREAVFTILFRKEKVRRLGLLFRGIKDGLAGKAGKGPVP